MEQHNHANGDGHSAEGLQLLASERAGLDLSSQLAHRGLAAVVHAEHTGSNGLPVETTAVADADEVDAERPQTLGETMGVLARVYCDPAHHRVSLYLDEGTANTLIYAARVLAAESEAHAREVRNVGASLPPESYGASNRHHIASRHERIAARLRVVEENYRAVVSTHSPIPGGTSSTP